MLGNYSIEFETYLLDIVFVSLIVAIWPVGVTYYTINDNITNLHKKHANYSPKFYLGCGAEV